jgi:hypothetical protein
MPAEESRPETAYKEIPHSLILISTGRRAVPKGAALFPRFLAILSRNRCFSKRGYGFSTKARDSVESFILWKNSAEDVIRRQIQLKYSAYSSFFPQKAGRNKCGFAVIGGIAVKSLFHVKQGFFRTTLFISPEKSVIIGFIRPAILRLTRADGPPRCFFQSAHAAGLEKSQILLQGKFFGLERGKYGENHCDCKPERRRRKNHNRSESCRVDRASGRKDAAG